MRKKRDLFWVKESDREREIQRERVKERENMCPSDETIPEKISFSLLIPGKQTNIKLGLMHFLRNVMQRDRSTLRVRDLWLFFCFKCQKADCSFLRNANLIYHEESSIEGGGKLIFNIEISDSFLWDSAERCKERNVSTGKYLEVPEHLLWHSTEIFAYVIEIGFAKLDPGFYCLLLSSTRHANSKTWG